MDEQRVGSADSGGGGGGGGAADRAKRHKERSLDDYKRKIYRLRLEVEQERLRCDQLRQQREHDVRLLADRLADAERAAADAERLRLTAAKQHQDECESLRRAHSERERELGAQLEVIAAEASRLRQELQRVAASEAKEALSSVHSETLSKLFRENKVLKQQIADWHRKHEVKCSELKEKAAECDQAQKELERERQRMLRESLSFRLTKLKQEQLQQQLPLPPSDGGSGGSGSAGAVITNAAGGDYASPSLPRGTAVASTDRERELQRKLAELNAIVQKLERRLESLKEENVQLKKRDEAARTAEEKLVKLKKRNGELAALAKKLDERNKLQQQQVGSVAPKKPQDAPATSAAAAAATTGQSPGDLEHVKKVFARQRAKDLAEHAKSTLAKERELEALRRKCFALADTASNDASGGGSARSVADLGDLASLIRITAKERLHLEWLKSRDWDDGSATASGLGDAGDSIISNGIGAGRGPRSSTAAAAAGAVEMLRSKLDSLLEENAALSRQAEAALAECEAARAEVRRQKEAAAAAPATAIPTTGPSAGGQLPEAQQQHQVLLLQLKDKVAESAMLQSALADARGQLSALRTECSVLSGKAAEFESKNVTITLEHDRQKREIERLEVALAAVAQELECSALRQASATSRPCSCMDAAVQVDVAVIATPVPLPGGSLSSSSGTDLPDAGSGGSSNSAIAAIAAGQIAELLHENASLREDKQELLSALEENTDLKKELRTLTTANKILRKDCDSMAELQRRLDAALLESESLRADAARIADRHRASEAEWTERTQADALALADVLRERTECERRCEQLRLDSRQLEKECIALRATYASTQSMLADSIQHNGHLQQELSVERDKLAACTSELDLCKNTVENVRAELESAKAALDDIQQRQQQQHDAANSGNSTSSSAACAKCGQTAMPPPQVAHDGVQTDQSDIAEPAGRRREACGTVGAVASAAANEAVAAADAVAASVAAEPVRTPSRASQANQLVDCRGSSSSSAVLVKNSDRVYQIYVAKCTYDPVCFSTGDDPMQELVINAGDYVLVVDGQVEADDGTGNGGCSFCEGLLLTGARGRVPLSILEPLGDLDPRLAAAAAAAAPPSPSLSGSPKLLRQLSTDRISTEHSGPADDRMQAEKVLDSDGAAIANEVAAMSESTAEPAAPASVANATATTRGSSSAYGPLHVLVSADASLLPCPQNLQLERQLSNSIVISWDAPDAGEVDSSGRSTVISAATGTLPLPTSPPVYAYNVYIDEQFRLSVPASGKLKALVEGVRARVPHRVAVTAAGGRGESDTGQCTIVIGEPPTAPTDVQLLSSGPGSVTVSFLPNDSNMVHAVLLDGQLVRNLRPGICRFHMDGLEPGSRHSISLIALPAADADVRPSVTGLSSTQLQTTIALHLPAAVATGAAGSASGDSSNGRKSKKNRRSVGQQTPSLLLHSARSIMPDSKGESPSAAAAAAACAARLSNGLSDSGSSEERWPFNSDRQPSVTSVGRGADWQCSSGPIAAGTPSAAAATAASDSPGSTSSRSHRGRGSQAPSPLPRLYVALADYDPGSSQATTHPPSEELALKRGQVVHVFGDVSSTEGFLVGELGGQRGLVPRSAVLELPLLGEVAEPDYDDAGGSISSDKRHQTEDARVSLSAQLPSQRPDALLTGADSRAAAAAAAAAAGTSSSNNSSSRRGSVMTSTVSTKKMVALYDYDPQQCSPNVDADLELAFRAGDVITVLGEMDEDGFYHGLLDGRTGLVPSNYLQH